MRLCGGRITRVCFSPSGALIQAEELDDLRMLFCILAGPLGAALMLIPLARWFPAAAACAFFQSAYNLLPIASLDGGRALRCAAGIFLSPVLADKLSGVVNWVCLFGIVLFALYASIWWKLGLMPLFFGIWLLIKGNFGKIPCKPGLHRVQ